ncbi:MAG: hypothetical protein ACJ77Z_08905 [Thermoleophilaceae bacterium]
MNTTELISPPQTSEHPSFGDEVAEFLPWVAAIVVIGPITLLTLMLWAPFLLLLVLVVAPVVAAGLLGVGVAILAMPFLLLRHLHRHAAERRRSPERPIAIPGAIAHVGGRQ